MSDKVIGGTPQGSLSLCRLCRMAHHIRGLNLQEEIYCRAVTPMIRIAFPVETCSIFDDKRMPSLYMMEQIAWSVQSRNRGPVGFEDEGRTRVTVEPPSQFGVPQGQPPITGKGKP